MYPDKWRRVTAIFEAALELPVEHRSAFVEAQCQSDAAVRAAVESLLAADQSADSFLERSAMEAIGLVAPAGEPRVIGRYEILERIGHGGFGEVFKARDPRLKRWVAVKTCRFGAGSLKERFAREAEIAAGLDHPNITVVFDVGVFHDPRFGAVPFLVQEFLAGRDLDHVIEELASGQAGPTFPDDLSLESKLGILIQVASGLGFAHRRGVVHRDIKPGNVRLLEGGRVKIMDFGIAKLADGRTQLTQAGSMMGTAAYMSPEQIRGEAVDSRSDLFSFGVLAYELLTFRCPFVAETQTALMYRVLHEAPPKLSEIWPECPPKLEVIVEQCLEKKAAARIPSADLLVAHLEAVRSSLISDAAEAGVRASTAVFSPLTWRRSWGTALRWGAAAVLVALSSVWVLRGPPRPSTAASAPAPPAVGQLQVDALPWGEVVAVIRQGGAAVSLDPQHFTPLVLALAPGRYSVTLRHPRAAEPKSCEVEVISGARVRCTVEFARVDVRAFLDQVGR